MVFRLLLIGVRVELNVSELLYSLNIVFRLSDFGVAADALIELDCWTCVGNCGLGVATVIVDNC